MKKRIIIEETQIEALVKLVNDEIELNNANGDGAYNTYWDNVKMALGYAVTH